MRRFLNAKQVVMMFRLIVLAAVLSFGNMISNAAAEPDAETSDRREISYTELLSKISDGEIKAANIVEWGWRVELELNDGASLFANVSPQSNVADRLAESGVETRYSYQPYNDDISDLDSAATTAAPAWVNLVAKFLPLAIFLGFLWFIVRWMRGSNSGYLDEAEEMFAAHLDRSEASSRKVHAEFLEELKKVLIDARN